MLSLPVYRPPRARIALLLFVWLLVAGPVAAQDAPDPGVEPRPAASRAERVMRAVQRFLSEPPTIYPFVGGVYPGGLLAAGPGLQRRFRADGVVDVHAGWSIRNYRLVEGTLKVPTLAGGRIAIAADGEWLDAPSVAFFGMGTASRQEDRTTFGYRIGRAGTSVHFHPVPAVGIGSRLDLMNVRTDGSDVEARFPPSLATAPSADPRYLVSTVFAEVDRRESPGYTTSGRLYRVDWSRYEERQQAPYSFKRLDVETDQFIPLRGRHAVIGVRALASAVTADASSSIPHFMLPDLGGSRLLRGYSSWRFRDERRLLLSGEYRWQARSFADLALFLDAGKVAPAGELNFRHLKTSYGVGVRFHGASTTALRVEFAQTGDGPALVFGFGPSF